MLDNCIVIGIACEGMVKGRQTIHDADINRSGGHMIFASAAF